MIAESPTGILTRSDEQTVEVPLFDTMTGGAPSLPLSNGRVGSEPFTHSLRHSGMVKLGLRVVAALGMTLLLLPTVLASQAADATPTKAGAISVSLGRALHAWSHFPAARSPRPLVLLEGYVLNPENGFPDDNSKIAFGDGDITAPTSWPASPTSSMGFPIIEASAAFKSLTAPNSSLGSPPPLSTTGVSLGSGLFLTDRGWRVLPAWLFSLSGVENPAKVVAVGPSEIYSSPVTRDGESPAQLSVTVAPGGRHIVANIVGAPSGTGPCTASYTLSIRESKHAVAIAVVTHPHRGRPAERNVACSLVGYPRHVTAVLEAPLGARVVVDAESEGAASATPASSRST